MPTKKYNLLLHRTFQYLGIMLVMAVMGGGYWYWKTTRAAQTIESDAPSFEAPLTHSLDLARGIGTPTYSRSDGADRRATVTDFEGLIRTVKNGEARFEGARRVENLVTYSEAFDNSVWVGYCGTKNFVANSGDITAPNGTYTAEKIIGPSSMSCGGTDAWGVFYNNGTVLTSGQSYTVSIWMRGVSGGESLTFGLNDTHGATVTLTAGWKQYSATFTNISNTSRGLQFHTNTSNAVYYVWGAQLEDVTGQSNQNPSEYVSTNVKTASPYHGAGVDGVKYFDTANGNTVTSNIVTEATGAKIPSSTLKGYLAEGARTNALLQSETLGTTWAPSNLTVATNSVSAPSGQTTAETLTATSTDATLTQSITGTAASYTFSIYLKRLTGTGTVSISADGTNFTSCAINSSSWTRCADTRTLTVASYSQTLKIAANGDAIYAWGAQTELGLFASSYIPTTSGTITRGYDGLEYVGVSNFNDTAGALTVDVTTEWTGNDGAGAYFIDDSSNYQRMSIWHWSGASNHIGADRSGGVTRNYIDDTGAAITSGALMRLGLQWTGSAVSYFRDGSLRGSDTTLTLPYNAIAGVAIGIRGDVNSMAYANIKNVRSWKNALTETKLNNLTSLTQATSDSAVKKTAIANVPSDLGLAGYWSFEDGSGTKAEDFSPSGTNTATFTGSPTWTTGRIGGGLSITSGTNAKASNAASINPGTTMSLSYWIRDAGTSSGWAATLSKIDGSSGWMTQRYDLTQSVYMRIDTSAGANQGGSLITNVLDGNWHHIVWTLDNGYYRGYKDGVKVIDTTYNHGTGFSSTADFIMGGQLVGTLDEVRLYDRALSPIEIADLYAQGGTAHTTVNTNQNSALMSGLVGFWSFNGKDLSGTTAYDRSGQGNDGTLTNSPSVIEGKVGQGLSFNGTSTYVSVPYTGIDFERTDPFSFSIWIRPEDFAPVGGPQSIIGRLAGAPSRGVYFVWTKNASGFGNSHSLGFGFGNGSGGYMIVSTPTDSVPAGDWVHAVVTYDGSSSASGVKIYKNGANQTLTTFYNNVSAGTIKPGINWRIGDDYTNDYAKGIIDDLRIYNRVLSTAEIAELYNLGR